MEKWSKEELEQVLAKRDGNRLRRLHEQIRRSSWRARYHIQTVTGLMNDPNGFSFMEIAGIYSINGSHSALCMA